MVDLSNYNKNAFYSKHIFVSDQTPALCGFLLVKFDKIHSIVQTNENNFSNIKLSLMEEGYCIHEFADSYIIPGIIDTNVILNSNFDEQWSDIENITQMAASGGTTTILDHPCLSSYENNFDEISNIEKRIKKMSGKLSIDCGLLANVTSLTLEQISAILAHNQVLGIKFSLQPPLLPMDFLNMLSFKQLLEKISSENACFGEVLLFVNTEKGNLKDLYATSPCRGASLSNRLDSGYEISRINDVFAGGFSHSIGQDDSPISSTKSESEEEEKCMDEEAKDVKKGSEPIDPILPNPNKKKKSSFAQYFEINSAELRNKCEILDEKKTLEHLCNAELSGYQHEDLACINEFCQETEQICLSTDEELKNSTGSLSHFPEEDEGEDSNKPLSQDNRSSFHSNDNNPALSEVQEFKKPFPSLFKPPIGKVHPLITQIRMKTKYDSENISVASSKEFGESPYKKKRKSLLDRRQQASPISSPLLQFLEIKTKVTDNIKQSQRNSDVSGYEKDIAKKYEFFLANRPANMEHEGVKLVLKEYAKLEPSIAGKVHIVLSNLSLSSSCALLKERKKNNNALKIYTEVGTNFLCLHEKKIKNGFVQYKCSPPIRDKENMQYLRTFFAKKNIDILCSGHMRVPFKYKYIEEGSFRRAFSGLSCVGKNLQIAWTTLYSGEKIQDRSVYNEKIRLLVRTLSCNPARILKIFEQKGSLEPGKDADFVIWNPFEISQSKKEEVLLKDKSLYIYLNQKFYGKVLKTYLRGMKVFDVNEDLKSMKKFLYGTIIKKEKNFL